MQILNEYLNPELIRMTVRIYSLCLASISSWWWTYGVCILPASFIRTLDLHDEASEVSFRRPSGSHCIPRHPFPRLHFFPDLHGPRAVAHDQLNAPRQLRPGEDALAVALSPNAGSPLLLYQHRVRRLVEHARRGDDSHTQCHGLQRRVPPAVGDEAPHGRVREDLRLVAPLHHHALPLLHDVLAHHEQVRPSAPPQPVRDLLHLLLAVRPYAAERDVHHRPLRLRPEPLHVPRLVGTGVVEQMDPRLGRRPDHGADGEHIQVLPHGRQRRRLQFVESVHEDLDIPPLLVHELEQLTEHRVDDLAHLTSGGVDEE
uniref:Uncharacterized protein n=1 Tax=Triticum urartu TaxID=4572 RepID=A0A8R7UGT0_TRIUA